MKYLKNKFYMIVMIFASFFVLFLQEGKAYDKVPTIEDLTKGKVKIGDLIDKNNVDLVKEYLTVGIYESVKKDGESVEEYLTRRKKDFFNGPEHFVTTISCMHKDDSFFYFSCAEVEEDHEFLYIFPEHFSPIALYKENLYSWFVT